MWCICKFILVCFSKGSAVTVADVRTCITDYVKNNDLQHEGDKR